MNLTVGGGGATAQAPPPGVGLPEGLGSCEIGPTVGAAAPRVGLGPHDPDRAGTHGEFSAPRGAAEVLRAVRGGTAVAGNRFLPCRARTACVWHTAIWQCSSLPQPLGLYPLSFGSLTCFPPSEDCCLLGLCRVSRSVCSLTVGRLLFSVRLRPSSAPACCAACLALACLPACFDARFVPSLSFLSSICFRQRRHKDRPPWGKEKGLERGDVGDE